MQTKSQSVMAGWPSTTETRSESGDPVITVKVDAIRPFLARTADWLGIIGAVAAIPASIFALTRMNDPGLGPALLTLSLPGITYAALKVGLYRALRTTTQVTFTPSRVTASRLLGERVFDRAMPHRFALYPHEKATREAEILNFRDRQKTRWYERPAKRYYGKSFRLSLDYLEQRNDLMLIYGHKRAQLALARLNAADQIMDGHAGKSNGQVLLPEAQWSARPGALQGEF